MTINIVVYHVKDLASAKPLFAALTETEPYADSPYYVGFRTNNLEIGLAPAGYNGLTGPVPYWTTNDIKGTVKKTGGWGRNPTARCHRHRGRRTHRIAARR